jgi:hypothetical protein
VIFGTFIQFLYDNIITQIQCLWFPVALKKIKKYTTLIFKMVYTVKPVVAVTFV